VIVAACGGVGLDSWLRCRFWWGEGVSRTPFVDLCHKWLIFCMGVWVVPLVKVCGGVWVVCSEVCESGEEFSASEEECVERWRTRRTTSTTICSR